MKFEMTRWKITHLKKPLLARNTKLLTVWGAAVWFRRTVKVPVVVRMVAVYFLVMLMVIGGGLVQVRVLTRVAGLAGQPAATARALARSCAVGGLAGDFLEMR